MTKTPAAPFVLKGIVCPSRTDFRCTQRTLKHIAAHLTVLLNALTQRLSYQLYRKYKISKRRVVLIVSVKLIFIGYVLM